MTERSESRKRAYDFIKNRAKQLNWDPPINSDERLANVLDIPLDELRSLKKGLSDPSQKLVAKFRNLVAPAVNEAEIDLYLVTPFLTKP